MHWETMRPHEYKTSPFGVVTVRGTSGVDCPRGYGVGPRGKFGRCGNFASWAGGIRGDLFTGCIDCLLGADVSLLNDIPVEAAGGDR